MPGNTHFFRRFRSDFYIQIKNPVICCCCRHSFVGIRLFLYFIHSVFGFFRGFPPCEINVKTVNLSLFRVVFVTIVSRYCDFPVKFVKSNIPVFLQIFPPAASVLPPDFRPLFLPPNNNVFCRFFVTVFLTNSDII